eukprot:TRINITY_DN4276_c0_g5_i3.p3 TRINITY_DN4276_c0_g5~~TRINITY_DN4276_c0_g5_i3.p3  ORF type:complete len:108 (+),score=17.45 TRINITY_DN4276_c0_g5_i3:702-1025(+)
MNGDGGDKEVESVAHSAKLGFFRHSERNKYQQINQQRQYIKRANTRRHQTPYYSIASTFTLEAEQSLLGNVHKEERKGGEEEAEQVGECVGGNEESKSEWKATLRSK